MERIGCIKTLCTVFNMRRLVDSGASTRILLITDSLLFVGCGNKMNRVQYFMFLSEQTLSFMLYFWYVSLGLLIACLVASVLNNPFNRRHYHIRNWFVFSPILITFSFLMVGTIFEYHAVKPSVLPRILNITLGLLQLSLSGILIWKLSRIRWFTFTVNLLILWCSLWAYFLTAMSISGVWV